ncbi:MAG: T9SS type A sorting domain-containing protein [Bacteroidales bacterium]
MRLIIRQYYTIKTILFLLLVFFSSFLYAQDAPIANISSITNATPGSSSLSIPVSVTNFNNIGQFTLTMKFDTTRVRFVSGIPNSSLSGMTITYSSPVGNTLGMLIFAWTGSSNQSLLDGSVLANLSFAYITSTGLISWAYTYGSVCQYKTYVGSTLTALNDSPKYLFYINGGISNRSAPSVFAPNIPSPSIGNLSIPLNVNNFSSIGGLTLYMEYDTTVIKYKNTFTKNASFSSSFLVGNIAASGSKKQIVIQWYGTTALSLANGSTLCTLNFTYLAGGNSTDLKFNDNGPSCEFTDGAVNILIDMPYTNFYNNGKVGTGNKLKGQLSYNNSVSTPLNGFTIKLIDSANVVVASTTTATYTDNSIPNNPIVKEGYYEFPNIYNKNYSLRINSSMIWGGVNSTDVLTILRHTVGFDFLTDLPKIAADVNLSKAINSTDALLIQLRTVGSIDQFQAGDWVYGDTNVSVNGVTTHDFKALATGDANQSYIPSISKGIVYTNFLKDGIIYASQNDIVELPIKVNDFLSLGAVTLEILYDANLIDVIGLNSSLNNLKFNIINGKIRIVWADCEAVNFQPNDVLLTLKLSLKTRISSSADLISFTNKTEFADGNGNIINFMNLKTSNIETDENQDILSIFPNPFNDKITINYKLPFDGTVKLKLYNYTGSCVSELKNEFQYKGYYSLDFDANYLSYGIYMATISLKNGENEFFKTVKIVK